jgi:cell division protein FtsB
LTPRAAWDWVKERLAGRQGRPLGRVALAIGAILLAMFVFGGKKGFFALVSMQREKWRLQREIEDLSKGNQALLARSQRLEKNPQLYEKTAREQLMLARPDERVYRFQKGTKP